MVVTFTVVWLLRRLDARWEAKAQAAREQVQAKPVEAAKPCWEEKGCPESQMAGCPACKWHDLPCWMARLRAENRLPTECYQCARFRSGSVPRPVPA